MMKKTKIVISDCHLASGRIYEGKLNPHEDFHYDQEMVELFEFYSTGVYGQTQNGHGVPVELIIAGDFFDFLNVSRAGEFDDAITEEVALFKLDQMMRAHPAVMEALAKFVRQPEKKITYLIGNHDAELFFPKIREKITRTWDPEGAFPSDKVEVVADRDRITFEGVEIRHGNQFEASNQLDFDHPLIASPWLESPILRLPWGSYYVMKIINRLRLERMDFDKIRPAKAFIPLGLILDPWFTIRFVFLSLFYFVRTRFSLSLNEGVRGFQKTFHILRQEGKVFQDLEGEARSILDQRSDLQTIIMGHTHRPMDRIYPDGKQYINTGTWMRMIHLDWAGLGRTWVRTYAHIELHEDGRAHCELRQWIGSHRPYEVLRG